MVHPNIDKCPRCYEENLWVVENPMPQFKRDYEVQRTRCYTCGWEISARAWNYAWNSPEIPYEDISGVRQSHNERV